MALLLPVFQRSTVSPNMKKIKQSFTEVIAGQPRKEHYINVTLSVIVLAIAAGALLTFIFSILNVTK
jgi:ABC-type spermidine/putrescine transport system permease subunit II